MQRVKKDDRVRVLSGKDAGKEGRVVRIWPREGRVMVEGINVMTKHRRLQRNRQGGTEGGIVHEETPFDLSNVMPICDDCGKATRVGSRVVDGRRVRVCRACDAVF